MNAVNFGRKSKEDTVLNSYFHILYLFILLPISSHSNCGFWYRVIFNSTYVNEQLVIISTRSEHYQWRFGKYLRGKVSEVVACFKVAFQHWTGEVQENQKRPQSEETRFEIGTFRIQGKNANCYTATINENWEYYIWSNFKICIFHLALFGCLNWAATNESDK